jgi:GT2 family glycosyltransferase
VSGSEPRFGCVVLTAGTRPAGLAGAVGSLLRQRGVAVDVAVVGNGWAPVGLPAGVHAIALDEPVGIPAGRNAGVPSATGELLFFLDDDATLRDDDALAQVAERFRADPHLGALQLRVDVSVPGLPQQTWVPRLRVGDPARSSDVAALWEGAVAIRRDLFERVGGWPADFQYVHEGVDLAWRVMDAGFRVAYVGDVVVLHPPLAPGAARRPEWVYWSARNRVRLARRYLPLPLGVVFVATFAVRTLPRMGRGRLLRSALRGYRDGMRGDPGRVAKLRVKTLWRMTRIGRPPVL